MTDFEKLGLFYLGRQYDLALAAPGPELLLYESKDLTTHAVCVGMTGSGKTGLCLTLLEEAAIDGLPAIAIDPKGDLGNLLLTFPELRPADFEAWIDPSEAQRQGKPLNEIAAETAERWRQGLSEWGQDATRIGRFREAVDLAIYTPGSDAGLSLSVLRSFAAPPPEARQDTEAMRDRISATVSGLLGLVEIEADPLRSREHILLSNLIDRAWNEGRDLDMEGLIRQIQKPPFDKLGVLDLESFFPAESRFELSMLLNNLIASSGFSAWTQGDPLDVGRLLYTPEGKPRLSILSLAHLSDAQRMFFVTLLLGEVIAWVRRQPGTSSLRALLYMDEVFGFFPPTANPPSKTPMLTLLKQARAYGLGIVLATQNPVDLDYKGLSNAGTWFLGRLQTERDKARVLDGLEGASSTAGRTFDRAQMEAVLSGLGNRVFLMNNVHEDEPVVFQTRWALSFLRGPITQEQIRKLMQPRKTTAVASAAPAAPASVAATSSAVPMTAVPQPTATGLESRPVLPPGIEERFQVVSVSQPAGARLVYRARVLGVSKVHFMQSTTSTDVWQDVSLIAGVDGDALESAWESATPRIGEPPATTSAPQEPCVFVPLLPLLARPKTYAELASSLRDHLYRTYRLPLWKCNVTKLVSRGDENEGDFRVRRDLTLRELRDAEKERLRLKNARQLESLQEKIRLADERISREEAQASRSTWDAVVTAGSSILGGLLGRKRFSAANVGRAASAAKAAGRVRREQGDVARAQDNKEAAQQKLDELAGKIDAAVHEIQASFDPQTVPLVELPVRPKKSDIDVSRVLLVWQPLWRGGDDREQLATE